MQETLADMAGSAVEVQGVRVYPLTLGQLGELQRLMHAEMVREQATALTAATWLTNDERTEALLTYQRSLPETVGLRNGEAIERFARGLERPEVLEKMLSLATHGAIAEVLLTDERLNEVAAAVQAVSGMVTDKPEPGGPEGNVKAGRLQQSS